MGQVGKRVLLGRKLATSRLQQSLPKRIALPVLASDSLSSVAYATQEMLVILTLGGLAYLYLAPWVAVAVVVAMMVIVASYRQLVQAYPAGGGDYDAAARNLGPGTGLAAASAMSIDYVLTVAVSVAAAADNVVSAFPGLADARVPIAGGMILLLLAINVRGVRQRGPGFAAPSYLFIAAIVVMVLWGLGAAIFGAAPVAESADYEVRPELSELTGVALVVLALRAFASGCVALTGVRAVAGGVPSFNRPRRKNAATTLVLMGTVSMALFLAVTALALVSDVRYARDACDLVGFDCVDEAQRTVIAQLAAAVFGDGSAAFLFVLTATVLILLVAANTAFGGFPVLSSILAQQRYLPRQLQTRGDLRAFRSGMLLLAVMAGIFVVAFGASVSRLLPMYLVAVFVALTLGQAGMIVHWNRVLGGPLRDEERVRARRSQVVSVLGALISAVVVVVVVATQLTEGVWVLLASGPLLFVLMRGVHRYYTRINDELAVPVDKSTGLLPSRVHAIVLVSRIHKPALRALAYARVGRPDVLEAITVGIDVAETRKLADEWDQRNLPVPLKVLDSPYREISRPVLEYVRGIRRASPRDLVAVYLPEYVAGRWWEQFLHNKSILRLRSRLMFTRGVVVITVPWQLESSAERRKRFGRAQ